MRCRVAGDQSKHANQHLVVSAQGQLLREQQHGSTNTSDIKLHHGSTHTSHIQLHQGSTNTSNIKLQQSQIGWTGAQLRAATLASGQADLDCLSRPASYRNSPSSSRSSTTIPSDAVKNGKEKLTLSRNHIKSLRQRGSSRFQPSISPDLRAQWTASCSDAKLWGRCRSTFIM